MHMLQERCNQHAVRLHPLRVVHHDYTRDSVSLSLRSCTASPARRHLLIILTPRSPDMRPRQELRSCSRGHSRVLFTCSAAMQQHIFGPPLDLKSPNVSVGLRALGGTAGCTQAPHNHSSVQHLCCGAVRALNTNTIFMPRPPSCPLGS